MLLNSSVLFVILSSLILPNIASIIVNVLGFIFDLISVCGDLNGA